MSYRSDTLADVIHGFDLSGTWRLAVSALATTDVTTDILRRMLDEARATGSRSLRVTDAIRATDTSYWSGGEQAAWRTFLALVDDGPVESHNVYRVLTTIMGDDAGDLLASHALIHV